MSAGEAFLDSNIVLYLLSADETKADIAHRLIRAGGVVTVQVLNEFASVASRKRQLSWPEIRDVLATLRALCRVEPISVEEHERGLLIAERYRFRFYDSLIIAGAALAGCRVLYSEDMQDGQSLEGLTISNPFTRNRAGLQH